MECDLLDAVPSFVHTINKSLSTTNFGKGSPALNSYEDIRDAVQRYVFGAQAKNTLKARDLTLLLLQRIIEAWQHTITTAARASSQTSPRVLNASSLQRAATGAVATMKIADNETIETELLACFNDRLQAMSGQENIYITAAGTLEAASNVYLELHEETEAMMAMMLAEGVLDEYPVPVVPPESESPEELLKGGLSAAPQQEREATTPAKRNVDAEGFNHHGWTPINATAVGGRARSGAENRHGERAIAVNDEDRDIQPDFVSSPASPGSAKSDKRSSVNARPRNVPWLPDEEASAFAILVHNQDYVWEKVCGALNEEYKEKPIPDPTSKDGGLLQRGDRSRNSIRHHPPLAWLQRELSKPSAVNPANPKTPEVWHQEWEVWRDSAEGKAAAKKKKSKKASKGGEKCSKKRKRDSEDDGEDPLGDLNEMAERLLAGELGSDDARSEQTVGGSSDTPHAADQAPAAQADAQAEDTNEAQADLQEVETDHA